MLFIEIKINDRNKMINKNSFFFSYELYNSFCLFEQQPISCIDK